LAVDFEVLKMPIGREKCLDILNKLGIGAEVRDVVKIARSRIGKTLYRRGALPSEWPEKLDCSALAKWAYGDLGVWLPRHSIDQREYGKFNADISKIEVGDLVFTTGYRNYYWDDPADGVGHVGVASSSNSIIHAANSKSGIIESYLDKFTTQENFRGSTRIADNLASLITLTIPEEQCLETSTAVRWRILQQLK
jgi:hypothetical protein